MARNSPFQVVVDGRKLCSKCGDWKLLADFNRTATRSSGHTAECKTCFRAMPSQHGERKRKAGRAWYRKNGMDRTRVKLYGLTPEGYAELLERQSGRCAICSQPPSQTRDGHTRPLYVDHCHDSGEIRGLLCSNCNVAIGMLRHDADLFDRARDYLRGQ